MKLSTLIEIIGSGSILLVVGVAILLLGISFGVSEATHLPLWATLSGMGLFFAIVGGVVLDRGTEEAEEQVKTVPLILRSLRNPYVIAGVSVFGGFILQRLFRGPRQAERTMITVVPPESISPSPEPHKEVEADSFSISQFLGDQLRTLGTVASGAAVSMAIKALGVPSIDQLVGDLLAGKSDKGEAAKSDQFETRSEDGLFEPVDPLEPSSRSSHNGFNYPSSPIQ